MAQRYSKVGLPMNPQQRQFAGQFWTTPILGVSETWTSGPKLLEETRKMISNQRISGSPVFKQSHIGISIAYWTLYGFNINSLLTYSEANLYGNFLIAGPLSLPQDTQIAAFLPIHTVNLVRGQIGNGGSSKWALLPQAGWGPQDSVQLRCEWLNYGSWLI